MSLPAPDAVLAGAWRRGVRTQSERRARDASIPNVVVAMDDHEPAVDATSEGYVGEGAPELGLLATAVDADDIALHYPDPDHAANGPWLVLEPLSGRVSTVQTGTGRVEVELDYDRAGDRHLDTIAGRIDDLLSAARPAHDRYPVADDVQGVFRTGMTTFTPDDFEICASSVTARFDVSTTPATTRSAVIERFSAVDGVEDVTYEPLAGVERADPSDRLRSAVERAHESHVGDAEYEWIPGPTVFSRIPGGQKIAFGTGRRGADAFDEAAFRTCRRLLADSISNLKESV